MSLIPKTVKEAANTLYGQIPYGTKVEIKRIDSESEMVGRLHHGFGTAVRNNFRLWHPDDSAELLEDALGEKITKENLGNRADEASGVILRELWNKVQKEFVINDADKT